MIYKTIQGFQGKHLPPSREDHLFHIFPSDAESPPADTGNHLVFRIAFGTPGKAQFPQMLNSGNLVQGGSVVLCNFTLKKGMSAYSAPYSEEVSRTANIGGCSIW